jgi:hypothetical protein
MMFVGDFAVNFTAQGWKGVTSDSPNHEQLSGEYSAVSHAVQIHQLAEAHSKPSGDLAQGVPPTDPVFTVAACSDEGRAGPADDQ